MPPQPTLHMALILFTTVSQLSGQTEYSPVAASAEAVSVKDINSGGIIKDLVIPSYKVFGMLASLMTDNPTNSEYFISNIENSAILEDQDPAKVQNQFPIHKIAPTILADQHIFNLVQQWKKQGFFPDGIDIQPQTAQDWLHHLVPYIALPGQENIDPVLLTEERVARFIHECQSYYLLPKDPGITTDNILQWLHLFVPIFTPTPVQLPPFVGDSWYWQHHYDAATAHWKFHGVAEPYITGLVLSFISSDTTVWSHFESHLPCTLAVPIQVIGDSFQSTVDKVGLPSPYGVKAIMVQTRARTRGSGSSGAAAENSKYDCNAHPLDDVLGEIESGSAEADPEEMHIQHNESEFEVQKEDRKLLDSAKSPHNLHTQDPVLQLEDRDVHNTHSFLADQHSLLNEAFHNFTQSLHLDTDNMSPEEVFARTTWLSEAQRAVQEGRPKTIPKLETFIQRIQAMETSNPAQLAQLMGQVNTHQVVPFTQSHLPQALDIARTSSFPQQFSHPVPQSPALGHPYNAVSQSSSARIRGAQQLSVGPNHFHLANMISPAQSPDDGVHHDGVYNTLQRQQAMNLPNSVRGGPVAKLPSYAYPYANNPAAFAGMSVLGGLNSSQNPMQSLPTAYTGFNPAASSFFSQMGLEATTSEQIAKSNQNEEQPATRSCGRGRKASTGTATKPRKRRSKASAVASKSQLSSQASDAIDETQPSEYDLVQNKFPNIYDHYVNLHAQRLSGEEETEKLFGKP